MVTLTQKELAEMEENIEAGLLPKNALKQHYENEALNVFGFDAKKDRKGNFVQQGIGSPGHETANHFAAIRKYEGKEAWEAAVREIWKRDPKHAERLNLPKLPAPKPEKAA